MINKFSRQALTGLGAILALGLTLTACGGSTAAEGEEPAGAASGALTSLKVLRAPVFFEPLIIADREGYFEEQGLDVEIIDGGTAAQQVAQLVSGKVDIAATGGVSTIAAVAQGMPIKAILGNQNANAEVITSGLLVEKDSPIQSYGDLEGKTVGLQGLKETTHLGSLLALEDAGVDTSSVEFVQLPLPGLNDALAKGQVDAAYNIGSFYPTGIGMGFRTIGSPGNEFLEGGPNAWYVSSDDFIAENGEAIEKFNEAMKQATEYAIDNPEVVQELQIEFTEQDPEYIKSAPIQILTWQVNRAGTENTINGLNKYKFIDSEVAYEDVVWEGAPQN